MFMKRICLWKWYSEMQTIDTKSTIMSRSLKCVCVSVSKKYVARFNTWRATRFSEISSANLDDVTWSAKHSVESPGMVDPQWNLLYWGSKWNLHTVCWDAVGCERGQTLFTLGLLMFALSQAEFLSLLWSPRPTSRFFYFRLKYHLKDIHKIFKKNNVGLKFEWDL